ncbi:MAG: hypothetical protein SF029_08315 [bacterium]|nr:hypothetical protein [bacterium]
MTQDWPLLRTIRETVGALSSNPLAQAERLHQRRAIKPVRRWARGLMRLLNRLLLVLAVLVIALSLMMYRFTPDVFTPFPLVLWGMITVVGLVVTGALLVYSPVVRRINQGCAESIVRERNGNTWELLLLTGISARRMAVGKWWGSFLAVWPEVPVAAFLRGAACVGLGAIIYPLLSYEQHLQRYLVYPDVGVGISPLAVARDIALAIALSLPLTVTGSLSTASVNMVQAFNRRHWTWKGCGLQVGLGCLALVLGIVGFFVGCFALNLLSGLPPQTLERLILFFGILAFTLVDSGLLLCCALANPLDANEAIYVAAAVVAMANHLLNARLQLRVAAWLARQQNVSP